MTRRTPTAPRGMAPEREPATTDVDWVVPEGTAPPKSIPADLFEAARAAYRAGERLDMQQLARGLGVSRATLYRRAGNRDQLFAAAIWWDGRRAPVDAVRRTASLTGVARVVEVARLVLVSSDRSEALKQFLESDPEVAMRILTGAHGGVQDRYIDFFERLFELETARGHLSMTLDLPSLSYAIVRLAEAFLYADVIADRERDIGRAVTIIDGLLRGLERPRAVDRQSRIVGSQQDRSVDQ
jgi:AcrR family transcriptional regulator